ncbi:MAG TPA: hypothetical protein VKE96_31135 [Vicinamibacterales bacterium]|nr:hypothetical protein [Vicinamibacterales bacterium]
MAETLLEFRKPVLAPDGSVYEARACGGPMNGGGVMWEGWIEFVPIGGGTPLRSGRETTQPNRADAEYWATGLTPVYLEGAFLRALDAPVPVTKPRQPSVLRDPAGRSTRSERPLQRVFDPFSAYEKGEALLRAQLGALSAWHLVNIVTAYELSEERASALNRRSATELIDIIVRGVRFESAIPK